MKASGPGRHLSTSDLLQHWENGVAVAIPLPGTPPLLLRIDPARDRLTLRAPSDRDVQPPENTFAHLAVEITREDGQRFMDISTTDERLVVDGYAMLTAIADRVQLDGMATVTAFEQTLATWSEILATRVRMGREAEIGLFGELLTVLATLRTTDAGAYAWRGGMREEHDLGFADADVEVKTTSGERRCHVIHGLGQLVPTGDTPLWLFSIQLTRAGEGIGRRLPELIDEVYAAASPRERQHIAQGVAATGWSEEQRDLLTDRWRLRSAPVAFRVTGAFPRLTPDILSDISIDLGAVDRVSYEIDLSGVAPTAGPPPPVAALVEHLKGGFDAD